MIFWGANNLKKLFNISLTILFVSLFLGMSFVKGDYAVLVGTVNTYDVNDSAWDFVSGPNSSSGTGFQFEGQKFAVGTQVSVTVDAAAVDQIDYTVDVGIKSDTSTTSSFVFLELGLMLFYPILLSSVLPDTWNQTEIDLGTNLMEIFFVDPTQANDFFYDFTNTTFVSSEISDLEWTFTEIGGTFEIDNNIAVFDWTLNAQNKNATANTNFSGTYSFIFAYDETTGEVMGHKIDLDYSGTTKGSLLDLDFLQEIEMFDYDLPYEIISPEPNTTETFSSVIVGFEWLITIPALALMGSLSAILKRESIKMLDLCEKDSHKF